MLDFETDLKEMDGEPYEIAREGGRRVEVALADVSEALEDFRWAARGAWMTAEYHLTGKMPKGEAFDSTATGRKIQMIFDDTMHALKQQRVATVAAGWNPKET